MKKLIIFILLFSTTAFAYIPNAEIQKIKLKDLRPIQDRRYSEYDYDKDTRKPDIDKALVPKAYTPTLIPTAKKKRNVNTRPATHRKNASKKIKRRNSTRR